jgi:hypothetical protein
MVVLRYQMQAADEAGEHRHPALVYREIGLNPVHAWPESIADCWILHCTEENVQSVALPNFIVIVQHSPEFAAEINAYYETHPHSSSDEMYRAIYWPPEPTVPFVPPARTPGHRVYSFADVNATFESPYGTFTLGAKAPEDR